MVYVINVKETKLSQLLAASDANIASSKPFQARHSSSDPSERYSTAQSTLRSSRPSTVTSQIYQFALGYPQTPPETSPVRESNGALSKDERIEAARTMGSFVFRWDHPANEVYVTGTFDDWAKSVKLEKDENGFSKSVDLPLNEEKIYYKFVVDENWTTDPTAPQEDDGSNNLNNVLTPDQISKPSNPANSAIMSGVTGESTTAALAGQVPKESAREDEAPSSDVPGSFPETPANEAAGFSVNPIPATSGAGNPIKLAPGEKVPDPSTLTSNTISSTVKDDPSLKQQDEESQQTFGVAPLPATSGTGNPIKLKPGEKVPDPSTFTSNTIDSQVTTDKESYEKGSGAPQLPNVVTPDNMRDSKGGMFDLPPVSGTMIPESSLPMGDGSAPTIQSTGAGATTAALAGNVPKEPRGEATVVPDGSAPTIQSAGAGSTTAALAGSVPKEPRGEATVVPDGSAPTIQSAGAGATTAALAGSVPKEPRGEAEVVSDGQPLTGGTSQGVPPSVQKSIDEMNQGTPIAATVPDVVQESITDSAVSPEAAGSKTMVAEKGAVEQELLKQVKPQQSAGEPAPTNTSTTTSDPPPTATVAAAASTTGAKSFPTKSSSPATTAATEPNKDNPITTADAPATTPATKEAAARNSSDRSRDISPMTKPTKHQTQPSITTGVGASSAPSKSTSTSTPSTTAGTRSPATTTEKKSKRVSGFFGKLLGKKDKDKDKK
ncbi:MAG: hypothetical protein Q9190_004929 [Brigantiaea leucoxantha]